MKKTVLVTGSNGQLGQCIQSITKSYPTLTFIFVEKSKLDITDAAAISKFFQTHEVDWCINCAAYTAVDKSETDKDQAFTINVLGARYLAQACQRYEVKLIHISTDFVFNGMQSTSYKEIDQPKPQGVYGLTKRESEIEVQTYCPTYFIVRTSWLYSEFGHNFMKTMLKLSSQRETLEIVDDQIGSPTYGVDLAHALLQIILKDKTTYGIYHYCNQGQLSWFDFAEEIFKLTKSSVVIKPILSKDYVSAAKRPKFSVLDTSKIREVFDLKIPNWKESLETALQKVKELPANGVV